MARRSTFLIASAAAIATAAGLGAQQAPAPTRTTGPVPAAAAPPDGPEPNAPKAPIPDGFTEIFNGKDLTGWHVSRTNHHGTTPDFRVIDGVLVGTQNPTGKGGILLTDRKYKNVEVFLEIKPDWGCDGGLFLRSSEAGEAYQVTLDYLPNGGMGGIYGERLQGVQAAGAPRTADMTPEQRAAFFRERNAIWKKAWKREEWNTVRARIEGDVPHITVWINGEQVTDFTDTGNHAKDGALDGMLAIQMHYSDEKTKRWVPGGFWRWRTIAVKELP
jgi:hypothetical protein